MAKVTASYDTVPPSQYGDLTAPAQMWLYDESVAGVVMRGNATVITKGRLTTTVTGLEYTGVPRSWTGPEGSVTRSPALFGKSGLPSSVTVNGISMQVSCVGLS